MNDQARERLERRRAGTVARGRATTARGADVGAIPGVGDQARRDRCERDLLAFLVEYFPNSTGLSPFSDDHRRVIGRIQDCVLRGGRFTNAVYRGFAKSTISELSLIWAVIYGHRKFGAIFAAEASLADKAITSIKTELSDNDLLLADFPEVCVPVRALEGKPQRCSSQTVNGQRTHIGWKKDTIVFPTVAGSRAAGSIVMSKGLGGSILGLRWKSPDGRQLRPDFVIVDDPQTRESARSPMQCETRLEILTKSVLKLAGHQTSIACVVNATVIEHDDMVDQLLDTARYPAWQGERIPMVRQWSDVHETMWLDKYRELRCSFAPDIVGDQARAHATATDYYLANREQMDAGCQVSWASCFDPEREHSAIQHAYNALIDDGEDVFASEFQQQPLRDEAATRSISTEDVRSHVIEVPRWVVPRGLNTLTAMIDVQEKLLYWAVLAWGHEMRGHIVAYGTYPEQKRTYFTLRDARKTLAKAAGVAGVEAGILAGLEAVAAELLDRAYVREDDAAELRISQMLVDANWAQTQGTVRDFCRRSSWGPRIMPTHGRFVGASSSTLSDRRPDKGERVGFNWRTSTIGRLRHLLFDTNSWKTFVSSRIRTPLGDPQSLTIHAGSHQMLAEQLSSEVPVRVESKERVVDEWRLVPGRDNHWLDCIVGAAAGASFTGISATGAELRPPPQRRTISREEMAARRAELMRRQGGLG